MTPRVLIPVDGAVGEASGQQLRAALALSAATGQGFEISRIRAGGRQTGLRADQVAAVRAVALLCGARVSGLFEGSPDLRFEPQAVAAGEFRFDLATAAPLTLLLQTLALPLARGGEPSRAFVSGGTHVPESPTFHYLAQHWAAAVEPLGLRCEAALLRAGFHPRGGGEAHISVQPWAPREAFLDLEDRGPLVELRGTSGGARDRGGAVARQRQAAEHALWESRRLTATWQELELAASSPGSFVMIEAVFERSRAAFSFLGQRGVRAEALGARAARAVLKFLEGEAAVDPFLADQLALPLALAGCGGRIATSEVTGHLETVVAVLRLFGWKAETWGRRGGPGGLEIER
jgi:RNA 3'-terminal phosphate cyclase (ATP)